MPSTQRARHAPARPRSLNYQIVEYVDGDSGEPLFGVVHRGKRVAWSLKHRHDALRWLVRHKVPIQEQLPIESLAAS
jgi:hypothetical protein